MSLTKIAAVIGALSLIIGTAYTLDGRWVRCNVYAAEISQIQMRQLKSEERGIRQDINDLEDRLEGTKLSEKRRGIYHQRLRELKRDLQDINEEKTSVMKKGGTK
jgi:predicted  nucleic acid-binding Zn-ribbon protein